MLRHQWLFVNIPEVIKLKNIPGVEK